MKYANWNKQFIGGVRVEGSSNTIYRNENPYNGEILSEIKLAGRGDIDAAYKAAAKAQVEWANTPPAVKSQVMEKAAEILAQRREEIIQLIIEETGSSSTKANVEIDLCLGLIKETASFPLRMQGEILPSFVPGKENRVYQLPIGVVGVISPWNFPLYLSMRSVAAALSVGNGVVIKPDIQTHITGGLLIAELFEQAGLPKGVLNVIVADLKEIGDAFVEHPIPRLISFTGSSLAGKHIGRIAGENLKKTALELGGNSAFIVLDDANLEDAASAAVFGKFIHAGQVCMAINRIIVDRKVYPQFVEIFKEKTLKIKTGNPLEADTFIGPMINSNQVNKVKGYIENAVEEGANVALEGNVNGNVMSPYILTDVKSNATILQKEIFGPVAVIVPVDSEEEAIQVANNTNYGLSSTVFSDSLERGVKVAKRIHTGMVHVNDQTVQDEPHVVFGGEKESGMGRINGKWALDTYTTYKWISIQEETRPYPF